MASGEPSEESARLFVALDPPEELAERLSGWAVEIAAERPTLRPLPPESLHLTLAFLGQHPVESIDPIAAALDAIAPSPVELRFQPRPFPMPRRRPRLFALGAESGEIDPVHRALERSLVEACSYEPDQREFWPHLSVLRVRGSGRPEPGAGRPIRRIPSLPDDLAEPFGAVRVALYRSNLRPEGPFYARLAAIELPQPGGKKR